MGIHDGDGVYNKNETETKQQFVGNADSEKRTVIEVNVDNENNGDYDQENGDNGDYYVDDENGDYVDDENGDYVDDQNNGDYADDGIENVYDEDNGDYVYAENEEDAESPKSFDTDNMDEIYEIEAGDEN